MNEENYTRSEDEFGVITFTPIKKEVKCWADLEGITGYYLDEENDPTYTKTNSKCDGMRDVFATKEQCEASIALAMLSQLMKDANGDWKPDWQSGSAKYIVFFENYLPVKRSCYTRQCFIAFETPEIRDRFLELHIDLINKAKPLL